MDGSRSGWIFGVSLAAYIAGKDFNACPFIGDVAQLGVGDIQELGQLVPVGGGLVEQNQKLRVCQHEPGGIGPEQFVG